jgi:pimeloyl-ACP methyl ester carboxylesterase
VFRAHLASQDKASNNQGAALKKPHPKLITDLRGTVQLSADAVLAVSDLVQALHGKIARPLQLGPSGAIAKFVYASVRGITRGVAKSADAVLALIPSEGVVESASTDSLSEANVRSNLLSVVNGVCGDHLADSANPLALPMQLLGPIVGSANSPVKYALFIHGLCLNESHWRAEAHVNALEKLGFTAIFLRYNSGLSITENGAQFAQLMQERLSGPGVEVAVIAHSMGGLVMRSALAHAKRSKLRWPTRLSALVFLGTPHAGAPLEQAGYWVDSIWQQIPYAKALAPIAKLRSVGIQDLRHGKTYDDAKPHKLPAKLRCFAIAASLSADKTGLKQRLLGDGLVPVESALGVFANTRLVPEQNTATFYGIGHLELLYAPSVTAQLVRWLT